MNEKTPDREFNIDFCNGKYYEDEEFPEDSYFVLTCKCGCGIINDENHTGRFPFFIGNNYHEQFVKEFTDKCCNCQKHTICYLKCEHCQKKLCFKDHLTHKIVHKLTGVCKGYDKVFQDD